MAKIIHALPAPIPTPEGEVTHGGYRDINVSADGTIVVSVEALMPDPEVEGSYITPRRYDRISVKIDGGDGLTEEEREAGADPKPASRAHFEAFAQNKLGKPSDARYRLDLSDLFAYADAENLYGNV